MSEVIVLNVDYTFLNVVSVKRAMKYITSGKVIIESATNKFMNAGSEFLAVPAVVRFTRFIRYAFSKKIRWSRTRVLIRDNYTCAYCGGYADTVDHIVPKTKGGKSTWENTVAACKKCNNIKGHKLLNQIGFIPRTKPYHPVVGDYLRKMHQDFLNSSREFAQIFS